MVQDDGVQHLPYEGWPLPGCGAPTLYPFFFWTYSISLPGDPVGMVLNWNVKSVSDVSKEVYAETHNKSNAKGLTRSAEFPNLANFCRTRLR